MNKKEKIIEILETEITGKYKPEYYTSLADRILEGTQTTCIWKWVDNGLGHYLLSGCKKGYHELSGLDEANYCPNCGGKIEMEDK